jgi:hypothetical protein
MQRWPDQNVTAGIFCGLLDGASIAGRHSQKKIGSLLRFTQYFLLWVAPNN